jgi:hypothetical protein
MKTLFVVLSFLLAVSSQACGGEAPDGLEQESQELEQVSQPLYSNLPSPDDDPVPVTRPVQVSAKTDQSTVRPIKHTKLADPVPIRGLSDLVAPGDYEIWSDDHEQ